jgi:hypothetical protein
MPDTPACLDCPPLDGTSTRAERFLPTLGRLLEEKRGLPRADLLLPCPGAPGLTSTMADWIRCAHGWMKSTLVGLGRLPVSNVIELITRAQALIALSHCPRGGYPVRKPHAFGCAEEFSVPLDTIECPCTVGRGLRKLLGSRRSCGSTSWRRRSCSPSPTGISA